jgi:hypothetical protein
MASRHDGFQTRWLPDTMASRHDGPDTMATPEMMAMSAGSAELPFGFRQDNQLNQFPASRYDEEQINSPAAMDATAGCGLIR